MLTGFEQKVVGFQVQLNGMRLLFANAARPGNFN